MKRKKPPKKEEHALVLDFLSHGYVNREGGSRKRTPIVQVLGKDSYTLLELVPKKDMQLELLEEVYIGKGERDKIHHINGTLKYDDLTSTAKAELDHAVKQLVEAKEDEFVDFFNRAPPMSTRTHLLQLLPGVGKKHVEHIITERRIEDFESYEDIKERVKLLKNPVAVVSKRIIQELKGEEKYNIFVGK